MAGQDLVYTSRAGRVESSLGQTNLVESFGSANLHKPRIYSPIVRLHALARSVPPHNATDMRDKTEVWGRGVGDGHGARQADDEPSTPIHVLTRTHSSVKN
jgi:hypothetical protein